jgi:hypothetical protein
MAELSERFAALMARLAQSDAELFRTLGEQNASVRQLLDQLVPAAASPDSLSPLNDGPLPNGTVNDSPFSTAAVTPAGVATGAVAAPSASGTSASGAGGGAELLVQPLAPVLSGAGAPANGALPPAPLLPAGDCELKALKRRFGRLDQAQAWLEQRLGKAPKRPTWAVVEQTCLAGAWPAASGRSGSSRQALSAERLEQELAALEQRLLQRLEPRLLRLEALLTRLAANVELPRSRGAIGLPPTAAGSMGKVDAPPGQG